MSRLRRFSMAAVSLFMGTAGVLAMFLFFRSPNSSRVHLILDCRSPDSVTAENVKELHDIADKVKTGQCKLDEKAHLLLLRAFTFGIKDKLRPDYAMASNLVASVSNKKYMKGNAEFLFLQATVFGHTAQVENTDPQSIDNQLAQANELLDKAKKAGSFEAEAKLMEGGFVKPPSKEESELLYKVWKEAQDKIKSPITAIFAPYVWLSYAVWDHFADSTTKTVKFLQSLAGAYSLMVNDTYYLLLRYDIVRTLFALDQQTGASGSEKKRNARVEMLLGHQGGLLLGSPALAGERKYILCTDEACRLFREKSLLGQKKPSLEMKEKGELLPRGDILFIPAKDILYYNKQVLASYPNDPSQTLVFKSGHPKNGYAYVQHPHRPNEYCELSDECSGFHWQMLTEKVDELRRVLELLGAKEIQLAVLDVASGKAVHDTQIEGTIRGETQDVAAKAETDLKFRREKYINKLRTLEIQLSRKSSKPVYPQGSEFPFFNEEKDWQTTAQDVCNGKLEKAKIRLAYTSDYGLNKLFNGNLDLEIATPDIDGFAKIGGTTKTALELNKSFVLEYSVEF